MNRLIGSFTLVCVLSWQAQAQDISKLLQRVPDSANVLTVIDMKALLKTPKSLSEGWAEKRNLDYLSGKVPFPPAMNFAVIASEFVHAERRNAWQISLVEFPGKVYEDKIAQREGSNVELIENQYVIPSRRNMYFVQFDRENYGLYSPANRQKMINWIKFAKSNTDNKVSQYLTEAVMSGGAQGQVNIAVDLTNTLDRVEITKRLQASKAVTDAGTDRTEMTKFLAGIRGVRLNVKVTNVYQAELNLDFNDQVAPYAKVLPGFLIETLEGAGFHLGDVSQWQSNAKFKTFTLKGVLENGDLNKVLAMVLPPTFEPAVESNLTGEALVATTSQAYFKAVDSLLKDLRQRSDSLDRTKAWTTNASWYEYTVKKIDSLPVVNTDEKLLAYSAQVADQLRLCAQSLRGVNIDAKVIDSYKREGVDIGWGGYYGGGYGGGGYGGGSYSNRQEIESAKLENAAKGTKSRNDIWVRIGDQTTAIRGDLAKKYRIEF